VWDCAYIGAARADAADAAGCSKVSIILIFHSQSSSELAFEDFYQCEIACTAELLVQTQQISRKSVL